MSENTQTKAPTVYANVIVDISVDKLDKTFQYLVPPELMENIEVGVQVDIPFGSRTISGYVVELTDIPEYDVRWCIESMCCIRPRRYPVH